MTRDDFAIGIGQDRIGKSEGGDAAGDLGDLRLGMFPRIARGGDQPVDRPGLKLQVTGVGAFHFGAFRHRHTPPPKLKKSFRNFAEIRARPTAGGHPKVANIAHPRGLSRNLIASDCGTRSDNTKIIFS